MSGLMGAEKIFLLWGGFEVAGAGVYLPASEIAFDNSVWGAVEESAGALPCFSACPWGFADCSTC